MRIKGMSIVKPCRSLGRYVNAYYINDRSQGSSKSERFFAGSGSYLKFAKNKGILSGQTTLPIDINIPVDDLGIAISLKRGAIYDIFNIPANHLTNETIDLALILGSSYQDMREQIFENFSQSNCVNVIESFLASIIDERIEYRRKKTTELEKLLCDNSFSISDIARETGYSKRNLQRMVNMNFGMSTSIFRRVDRFERAMQIISNNTGRISWNDIVFDCQYSDQPHFIREFKAFTGYTPTEYSACKLSDPFNQFADTSLYNQNK
jgi:AraC-like DNA-binding protein